MERGWSARSSLFDLVVDLQCSKELFGHFPAAMRCAAEWRQKQNSGGGGGGFFFFFFSFLCIFRKESFCLVYLTAVVRMGFANAHVTGQRQSAFGSHSTVSTYTTTLSLGKYMVRIDFWAKKRLPHFQFVIRKANETNERRAGNAQRQCARQGKARQGKARQGWIEIDIIISY